MLTAACIVVKLLYSEAVQSMVVQDSKKISNEINWM